MAKFMRYIGDGKIKSFDEASAGVGDISQTLFAPSNNQAVFADITGLLFDPSLISGARIYLTSDVSASSSKYTMFMIDVKEKNGTWALELSLMGDQVSIGFNITDAGQVQYTTPNFSGFSSASFSFRAFSSKK